MKYQRHAFQGTYFLSIFNICIIENLSFTKNLTYKPQGSVILKKRPGCKIWDRSIILLHYFIKYLTSDPLFSYAQLIVNCILIRYKFWFRQCFYWPKNLQIYGKALKRCLVIFWTSAQCDQFLQLMVFSNILWEIDRIRNNSSSGFFTEKKPLAEIDWSDRC